MVTLPPFSRDGVSGGRDGTNGLKRGCRYWDFSINLEAEQRVTISARLNEGTNPIDGYHRLERSNDFRAGSHRSPVLAVDSHRVVPGAIDPALFAGVEADGTGVD